MRPLPLVPFVLLLASGCATWTEVPPPWTEETVAGEPRVQLTLDDGSTFVLGVPWATRDGECVMLVGQTPEGRRYVSLDHVRVLRVERGGFVEELVANLILQGISGLAGSALRF